MKYFLIGFVLATLFFLALIFIPAQALTPLEQAEYRIAGLPYEEAVGFYANGRVAFDIKGTDTYVIIRLPAGYVPVITHNHPCTDQDVFSRDDENAARIANAQEFRVVSACPAFKVHRLIRTGKRWPYLSQSVFDAVLVKVGYNWDIIWPTLADQLKGFRFE